MVEDIRFTITINRKEKGAKKRHGAEERNEQKKEKKMKKTEDEKFYDDIIAMETAREKDIERRRKFQDRKDKRRTAAVSGGIGAGLGFAKNPAGALTGAATSLITKIFGPAAIAFIAYEVFDFLIKNVLFAPGGIFDRRLNIKVEDQIITHAKRQELADRQLGKSVVRATSTGGLRGRVGSVGGTLENLKLGRTGDIDFERDRASRGLLF